MILSPFHFVDKQMDYKPTIGHIFIKECRLTKDISRMNRNVSS